MKTLCLFPFTLLTTGWLMAQNVFPGSNAYWRIQVQEYPSSIKHYYSKGDTTIQDQSYTKVYVDTYFIQDSSFSYQGAYRTEGERVYYLEKNSSDEYLLYDFSLQVGDTLPHKETERKFLISKIDTIYYYGRLRKRQTFKLAFNTGSIMEGIGSYFGPFGTRYWDALDSQYTLQCFKEGYDPKRKNLVCEDIPLFISTKEEEKTSIQLYPNPSKGLFTLHNFGTKPMAVKVYDGKGNLCVELQTSETLLTIDLTPQPKGIYYLKTSEGQVAKLVVE